MGRQADDDSGPGDAARPADGLPGLLAAFEHGGMWDAAAPSAALAAALEAAAGPRGLYDGAGAAALVGITRQWAALESHAAAEGLGSLRAMMREDGQGRPLLRRRTDLPDGWGDNLNYEIAGALAMGPVSAGHLARLAWTLGMRLPGIGRLLADGTLTKSKARLIAQTFEPLDEGEAARAEALILGDLKGKTWPQVQRLAWRAALAVAPDLAERRRTEAEKRRARVTIFREDSGAVGLSGRDLPAAQALSGHANVLARAEAYEKSGAFPDHTGSALQALAYLHLLGGISAQDAIAFARTSAAEPPDPTAPDDTPPDQDEGDRDPWDEDPDDEDPWGEDRDGDDPHGDRPHGEDPDGGDPDGGVPWGEDAWDDDPWDDEPDRGDPSGQAGSGPDAPGSGQRHSDEDEGPDDNPDATGRGGIRAAVPAAVPAAAPGPTAATTAITDPAKPGAARSLPEVTAPLATLQRRAERAGENRLLGPLDPALTRDLAAAAARSPHARWEITIVDDRGYAIGHGTARPGRGRRQQPQPPPGPARAARPGQHHRHRDAPAPAGSAGGPAALRRTAGDWHLAPRTAKPWDDAWILTLPGGRELTARLDVVPTHSCDHRYQVNAYQPGDRLRRLVQVRDHECTWPPCSRPARESDFEHAIPYDKAERPMPATPAPAARTMPPGKAIPRLDGHAAEAGLARMDDPDRPDLRAGTLAVHRVSRRHRTDCRQT